jgi:hypothetical protein
MLGTPVPSVRTAPRGPYATILGDAYGSLHSIVRQAHEAPLMARGTLVVEHGPRWWTPLLVRAMRLPGAGPAQPVRLELAAAGEALTWSRQIGSSPLQTIQSAESGRLIERSGIGRVTFALSVHEGSLVYRQQAFHVGGIRVPDPVSPRVHASVGAAKGGWRVWVEVSWRGHLVCRYAGIISAV